MNKLHGGQEPVLVTPQLFWAAAAPIAASRKTLIHIQIS